MWHDGAFLEAYKSFRYEIENHDKGPWAEVWRRRRLVAFCAACALALALCVLEVRTSWIESNLLPAIARRESYSLAPGQSRFLAMAPHGPYDTRLGMAELPSFVHQLESRGYLIREQARDSRTAYALSSIGIDPVYQEKNQAGLTILDWQGRPLYSALYPHHLYANFHAIPPLVIQSLLFIENRQLLDLSHPRRNPAIQWGRLSRAFADLAIHTVDRGHPLIGGSTLPTQLAKIRHSPAGRTGSMIDKARQVVSASLRSYESGPNTVRAQQEIVCDYINSIPLAATRDEGEVIGLADGLYDWYRADPDAVNQLLRSARATRSRHRNAALGRAYRETLSLLLALHAPTRELVKDPEGLNARVDRYLRALAKDGVISSQLRDLALRAHPRLRPAGPAVGPPSFAANKAPNAIRAALLPQLGLDNFYALDRLDLTVRTTLDQQAQESVSRFLQGLSSPQAVQAAGLTGHQLLGAQKQSPVIYSVMLYERANGANVLRLQTDNYNQPLDINQGTRLQLGSTAKLRTLIEYLQLVEQLHGEYAGQAAAQLAQVKVLPGDALTKWAVGYLAAAQDRGLEPMLRAALARKYSGSPGESFFTAGGLHHFANFDPDENGRIFTVADAFQNSVNLAFIRLMRDIEHYYIFRVPGASPSVLEDANDPARRRYLDRFADFEGRTFLRRFYAKYDGQSSDRALQTLVAGVRMTPLRAAVIFRSVRPDASLAQFSDFLTARFPHPAAKIDAELYAKYGPDKFNLNDRGYLAHVHPLELWLLNLK